MKISTALTLFATAPLICSAFNSLPHSFLRQPSQIARKQTNRHVLFLSPDADKHRNKKVKRTDIHRFLTQRTIQSFMHLLKQVKDPHTATWIETFIGSKNLLSYHGIGAICEKNFPSWDSVFTELLETPIDVVIVEIESSNRRRGLPSMRHSEFLNSLSSSSASDRGNRGGAPKKVGGYLDSLTNPSPAKETPSAKAIGKKKKIGYLDNLTNMKGRNDSKVATNKSASSDKSTTFKPTRRGARGYLESLVPPTVLESTNHSYKEIEDRVVEFEIDIDPVSLAGRMLSVRQKIAHELTKDLDLLIAANDQILTSYNHKLIDARSKECENSDREECSYDEQKKLKPVQGSISGSFNFGQRTIQTFERPVVYMLNNHPNFNDPESTLLRSTSFDLLFLLSLQESIERVLKAYKVAGEEKEISFAWFLDYYKKSLDKYFDGNQSFGRADDFLDDLLSTPPSLKTIDGAVGIIDPLSIVEDIIRVRKEVATEWKLLISEAPSHHEILRREIFVKQMTNWGQTNDLFSDINSVINNEKLNDGNNESKEEIPMISPTEGEFE